MRSIAGCIQKDYFGPYQVNRRACALYKSLQAKGFTNDFLTAINWVNTFAIAVSEENAAGGRVVTAPTNGASGIIPAVLCWYDKFIHELDTYRYSLFSDRRCHRHSVQKMPLFWGLKLDVREKSALPVQWRQQD